MFIDKKSSQYLFEKKRAADQKKQWNGIGKKPRKPREKKETKKTIVIVDDSNDEPLTVQV